MQLIRNPIEVAGFHATRNMFTLVGDKARKLWSTQAEIVKATCRAAIFILVLEKVLADDIAMIFRLELAVSKQAY